MIKDNITIKHIEDCLEVADSLDSSRIKLPIFLLDNSKNTSNKISIFLNLLCSFNYVRYFQYGVFEVSSLFSVLFNNNIGSAQIFDSNNSLEESFSTSLKEFQRVQPINLTTKKYIKKINDINYIEPYNVLNIECQVINYDWSNEVAEILKKGEEQIILVCNSYSKSIPHHLIREIINKSDYFIIHEWCKDGHPSCPITKSRTWHEGIVVLYLQRRKNNFNLLGYVREDSFHERLIYKKNGEKNQNHNYEI